MDIGIIGLPQSGKTTVFNALTNGKVESSGASGSMTETHLGVVKVPDLRLDRLAKMFNPKKVVPAEVRYFDLPGLGFMGQSKGITGQQRNVLQTADAFLLVVRAFVNPAGVHPLGSDDPLRDMESMLGELVFSDLEILDRAVIRIKDGLNKAKTTERPGLVRHGDTVAKAKMILEDGKVLRGQEFSAAEMLFLADYQLLTFKPIILAFNTDESTPEFKLTGSGSVDDIQVNMGFVSLPAKLENELVLMSDEDQEEFRRELGLAESAMSRVIAKSYETVGLISFLTVGSDEVRAWSVPSGIPAQDAAGTIHTDFSRGFIRAEVITYSDLDRCGSIAQGRKEGLLRSEGKTYLVKDGDVINFLINV